MNAQAAQLAGVKRLKDLRNVGKAALVDFRVLEIESVFQLAQCDPQSLYQELQKRTGRPQDPCVWDVLAATIHEARTGEALDWWTFTPRRKSLTRSSGTSKSKQRNSGPSDPSIRGTARHP
jgi:nucleotidyltransferase/DNA polymerase involved in DNA repair